MENVMKNPAFKNEKAQKKPAKAKTKAKPAKATPQKPRGKLYYAVCGAVIGAVNGLFGSGGGVAAVPALKAAGLTVKESHASSLAVTLPLSAVSAIVYSFGADFKWEDALPLIPFGLAGAVIGGLVLKKLSNVWLKRIFGALLIAAGLRMLLSK
jgi:uncharacterized membrane protein YfcA